MGRLLEVIRDREPVEAARVCETPEPPQLIERPAEMADVYPEPDTRNCRLDGPVA